MKRTEQRNEYLLHTHTHVHSRIITNVPATDLALVDTAKVRADFENRVSDEFNTVLQRLARGTKGKK